MTQAKRSVLMCDAEDGDCGAWEVDYYAETASTVDGIPITHEHRAPGWTSTRLEDFCPEHSPATTEAAQ